MPKIKTHKATAKRFRIKKSARGIQIIKRADGQDHFNSRESGKTGRAKRSDVSIARTLHKTIKRAMPYSA